MKTDYRALCAELLDEVAARPLILDRELIARARAALAEPVGVGVTDEELGDLWSWAAAQDQGPWPTQQHCFARAVLARWGRQPVPPAAGEVERAVADLRECADLLSWLPADGAEPMRRAADLLEHHPAPVPVAERLPGHVEQALIKAECALSDIAEGEPEENEGDSDALLLWAEQRAAAVLARIRPVMREHGIRTSEWLPLPAGEVQP